MAKRIAPWFKECTTYSNWPQMPKAHGPFGKDRLTSRERKFLGGIPMFFNVQTPNAIKEAHELGGRALSYVSFMDTYVHTEGFENGTARTPWDPDRPQVLLLDRDGRFCNTPMDGTWRMWRYLVCSNTRDYVEAALEMVHRHMKDGADGLFVDNSGPRRPCYGHGLPSGYSEGYRQVLSAIPSWKNRDLLESKTPEELYALGERPDHRKGDPRVDSLSVHRHIYPGESHDYAYGKLLEKVRKAVRSYGPDKVVVLNGGWPFAQCADGVMLESFVFSWAWKGPRMDWAAIKERHIGLVPRFQDGTRGVALTYLGRTKRTVAEDALFACSAAILCGYLWSDYGSYREKLGDTLRRLDLGGRLTELGSSESVDYSFFEKGLVAVNGGPRKRTVALPIPEKFGPASLRNLIDDSMVARDGDAYRIAIPAHSGRILLADGSQE